MKHIPVLHSTVLDLLDPKDGETVIDVTLGLGGHAKAFLERIGSKGKLFGLDADKENLENAQMKSHENAEMIHANFRELPSLNLPSCDVLFADLGLSSPHLDDPSRGFSFRSEAPLDCRYDRSGGLTAAEILKRSSEEELVRIFKEYGELQKSHTLSRQIKENMPETTTDLVSIAEKVYGFRAKKMLPQVFQALRIAVNDEIGALQSLLEHGLALLKPGGRMAIISYHSLEDRMVKQRFRALTKATKDSITGAPIAPPSFELLTKKAIQPTLEEIENNPRARSARLRAIKKLA